MMEQWEDSKLLPYQGSTDGTDLERAPIRGQGCCHLASADAPLGEAGINVKKFWGSAFNELSLCDSPPPLPCLPLFQPTKKYCMQKKIANGHAFCLPEQVGKLTDKVWGMPSMYIM